MEALPLAPQPVFASEASAQGIGTRGEIVKAESASDFQAAARQPGGGQMGGSATQERQRTGGQATVPLAHNGRHVKFREEVAGLQPLDEVAARAAQFDGGQRSIGSPSPTPIEQNQNSAQGV